MKYKLIKIKPISKFQILLFRGKAIKKRRVDNINFSMIFWNYIFDPRYLKSFLEKYIKYKELSLSKKEDLILKKEIKFLKKKMNFMYKKINFIHNLKLPKVEDLFFSFRYFSSVINYYNDYYNSNQKVFINLKFGLVFNKSYSSIETFFKNIDFYYDTLFIKKVLFPLFKKEISFLNKGNKLYKFEIFWPDELILVFLLSKYIKEKDKKSQILLDFSKGNEQFSFQNIITLIKKSGKDFCQYIDFFILDTNYLDLTDLILSKLNNKKENIELLNVLYIERGKVIYKDLSNIQINIDYKKNFLNSNLYNKKIIQILGNNFIYGRLSPNKCYWDNCNFCAINIKHKLNYNNNHNYFINKWIDFILKKNIKLINFIDEAIPPKVILFFAKKIIKENINIKYLFRTRFEKLYTYKNCKILAKSGCGFCGIGLESAVDRVNEQIANKGNKGITLRDKIKIIHNFDKAGISIHNYAIMGFPGETKKEIAITYTFLKNNIINSNYYTCSPNIFGLMKGTKFFEKKEIYGIEIKKKDLNNPFKLIYDFSYLGEKQDLFFLSKLLRKIHREQLLPWLKTYDIDVKAFWNYLDRSFMFNLMKIFYNKNPFIAYFNINKKVVKLQYKKILQYKFHISDYIQVLDNKDFFILYSWIYCKFIYLPREFEKFILKYENNKSLELNLINSKIKGREIKKYIYILLENNILLFKK